jgi:hypothetical protein
LPNSDRQIQLLSLHNVKLFDTFLMGKYKGGRIGRARTALSSRVDQVKKRLSEAEKPGSFKGPGLLIRLVVPPWRRACTA